MSQSNVKSRRHKTERKARGSWSPPPHRAAGGPYWACAVLPRAGSGTAGMRSVNRGGPWGCGAAAQEFGGDAPSDFREVCLAAAPHSPLPPPANGVPPPGKMDLQQNPSHRGGGTSNCGSCPVPEAICSFLFYHQHCCTRKLEFLLK